MRGRAAACGRPRAARMCSQVGMKRSFGSDEAAACVAGSSRGAKATHVDWDAIHSRTLERMGAAQRLQAQLQRLAPADVAAMAAAAAEEKCTGACAHCAREARACGGRLVACCGCREEFCSLCSVLDYSHGRDTVSFCFECKRR